MSLSPRQTRRLAAWTAAAALGGLAMSASAFALPAPGDFSVTPSGNTAAEALEVSFSPVAPDDPADTVSYEVGLNGAGGSFAPIAAGGASIAVAPGAYSVVVRAVETGAAPGTATTDAVGVTVDRTPPTIAVSLDGTAANGWFRALQIKATCGDDILAPSGCPPPITWTTSTTGDQGPVTMSVTDVLNRTSSDTTGTFKFDDELPTAPQAENLGDFVSEEPTFKWFPAIDAHSGVDRYIVQFRIPDADDPPPWNTIAEVQNEGQVSFAVKRDPDLRAAPLPEFQRFEWRVRAFDLAGNVKSTSSLFTTIDPTTPSPPLITAGPNAPTRDQSPRFTWEGDGPDFEWDLVTAGSTVPYRSGNGRAREVTLNNLPDGAYTFQLVQITPAGRPSELASRSFVVDTTPPSPPTIIGRPTFPSLGDAIFSWSTEPGAYSRWSVTGRSGNAVVQPTDTPVTQAKLPSLAEDAYTFSVTQVDAAGNESQATVEPFTVIAPLVVPAPSNGIITLLPKQNARRLQPKAGKTVFSRTPVLRWTRGPKGTKLFNLQIFRVTVARNSRTPKVTKILSAFPKGRAYRVPKGKTRPKTCYVWRVWPYTGREFTPKPLGVSNYCVASQKVLARKAAIIATRKAAKAAARSRR
jgi:hypothetical protein